MKFLIIGDLHGVMPKIHFKDFDAIIAPGDFCSDGIKPLLYKEYELILKDPEKFVDWYDMIGRVNAKKEIKKSLADGRKILEKLNGFGVPVYLVPGNWDWTAQKRNLKKRWKELEKDHFKIITSGLKNIMNVHRKSFDAGELAIIGHGITHAPEYPQEKDEIARFSKNELLRRKNIYQKRLFEMSKLFSKAGKPVIFLTHNVPYNTTLDLIKDKRSPRAGMHFGSLVARKLIEEHQPLLCIGAHMHENFGKTMLGKTLCINAGFGSSVNTFVEIKDGKIVSLKFHGRNA